MSYISVAHSGFLSSSGKFKLSLFPTIIHTLLMRVLVIAATPPPCHGQSYMTQLLLDEFQQSKITNHQFTFKHLNSAISADLSDLGKFSLYKIFRVLILFIRILLLCACWKPHIPRPIT